jgi:hypothetical protein
LATPQEVFDSIKDWVAVSNGQLGATWAYLTGQLKIRGDQDWLESSNKSSLRISPPRQF